MKKYTALKKFRIIDPILKDDQSATQLALYYQIPLRTIRYWKKQFLTKGLSGLERSKRTDKDKHRKISMPLVELVRALALQKPPLTIAAIGRKLLPFAQAHSLRLPSYSTVYSIVKGINPALFM